MMKKTTFIIIFLSFLIQISAQNLIKITSADLNFRTSPKIEKNIIKVIPKGTTLVIDYTNQKFNSWIKLTYKGNVGFVYHNYLKNHESRNHNTWKGSSYKTKTSTKFYKNSKGEKVQSPTYYKSAPAGATAECNDGTYSFSQSHRGTCSHHGGVKLWL